jgi:hypothetical protein
VPDPRTDRVDRALLAVLAAVNFWLVLRFFSAALTSVPNTGDEWAVLFQARIFASGRWTAPAPRPALPLMTDYLGARDGRWFSVYPPLFPLLLAGGLLLGDARLVPAALSSLSLALLFLLVRRAYADRALAWCSTLLLFAAPSFRLYSASYYTHSASLAALLAALYACWPRRGGGPAPGPAAAAALAAGAAVRPFETFWAALPLARGFWESARKRAAARWALGLGAAAALAAAFSRGGAYLQVVNSGGKLSLAGASTAAAPARVWWMFADTARWLFGWGLFRSGNLKDAGPGDLNLSAALALAALAFAAWERRRAPGGARGRAHTLLLGVFLFAWAGHLLYDKKGGRFGERRLFEAEFVLCVLAARLLLAAEAAGPKALRGRLRWALFASLSGASLLFYLPRTVARLRSDNERRLLPFILAERQGLDGALIFVRQAPDFYPAFYVRNDPDLAGNAYAAAGPGERAAASAAGPRPQYEFRFDEATGRGTLTPRRPPVTPLTEAELAAAAITPEPSLIVVKGGEAAGYADDRSSGPIVGAHWLSGGAR